MIKIDKLNIDVFVARGGKNYRKAKVIDKTFVSDYFQKKGFEILEINQPWRHVYGKLRRGSKLFFFKMASTEGIGERTKNEFIWNKKISSLIPKNRTNFFNVPRVIQEGNIQGLFYYLSDFYGEELLATKSPINIQGLEEWLDKIIETTLFLLAIRSIKLPRDEEDIFANYGDSYYTKIAKLHEEVKDNNLYEVLQEVKKLITIYEPSMNHGDFVPWHMIRGADQVILIDGEHASSKLPKYYDVVYFYHRLYTNVNSPDLAKRYMSKFRDRLTFTEKKNFDRFIRPVLAARIIGGFWDAKAEGVINLDYHNKLKDDFLKRNLY